MHCTGSASPTLSTGAANISSTSQMCVTDRPRSASPTPAPTATASPSANSSSPVRTRRTVKRRREADHFNPPKCRFNRPSSLRSIYEVGGPSVPVHDGVDIFTECTDYQMIPSSTLNHVKEAVKEVGRNPSSNVGFISQRRSDTAACLHLSTQSTAVNVPVIPVERDFQAVNNAMKFEERALTPSLDVELSSSDSAYCSHRPMISTDPYYAPEVIGAALEDVNKVGQETKVTDEIISSTLKEINKLRNKQDLIEHALKNLLCSCHGKPIVTCMGMQAPEDHF